MHNSLPAWCKVACHTWCILPVHLAMLTVYSHTCKQCTSMWNRHVESQNHVPCGYALFLDCHYRCSLVQNHHAYSVNDCDPAPSISSWTASASPSRHLCLLEYKLETKSCKGQTFHGKPLLALSNRSLTRYIMVYSDFVHVWYEIAQFTILLWDGREIFVFLQKA